MSRSLVRKTDKAMPSKLISWTCPLCIGDEPIVRGSEEFLQMAVASHLLFHEERAALKAVDRARIECRVAGCEIGKKNCLNLGTGNPCLALSEFDRTWLQAMKINGD
jgi:hypothetical protein